MAKIGVIGAGFVGSAVINGFNLPGNEIIVSDPKVENSCSIKELVLKNPDFIFICVPTPIGTVVSTSLPLGYVDTSIVEGVVNQIAELITDKRNPLIIIKSTITPDFWQMIDGELDIVYNPEFLKESSPDHDFHNPPCVVLGGDPSWTLCVEQLYRNNSRLHILAPYIHTTAEIASFHKYIVNCWLATKVAFFNQLHSLMHEFNCGEHYDQLAISLTADPRIGSSHMMVPGPDGKYGYGGSCFPKDTKAFASFAKKFGSRLTILEEAIRYNDNIRNKDEHNDIQQK